MASRRVRTETFGAPIPIGGTVFHERVVLNCGCCLFVAGDVLVGQPCMVPHQQIVDLALARARETRNPAQALFDAEAEIRPSHRGE